MTHPNPSPILADRAGPLLTLALSRPDRLDAVSLALYERLIAHLKEADADASVRCVIVTGKGRAFCAGADLKAYRDRRPSPSERERYTQAGQRANYLMQTIGTPVVAAVNGHAVGAGLELALSADFAIVARDAKLRKQNPRWGRSWAAVSCTRLRSGSAFCGRGRSF